MALDVESVRSYCKIDDVSDTDVVEMLTAAKYYVINAIELKTEATLLAKPMFSLCVKMLISHWYDNRGVVKDGAMSASIPFGVTSLITQLANCYEAAEATEGV